MHFNAYQCIVQDYSSSATDNNACVKRLRAQIDMENNCCNIAKKGFFHFETPVNQLQALLTAGRTSGESHC